jgi:hypothetical protein
MQQHVINKDSTQFFREDVLVDVEQLAYQDGVFYSARTGI